MNKLKIAYFGTPYFSALFLEKLLTDTSLKHLIEIKLVITQPDQPTGRKQELTKSPVKIIAENNGITVFDNNLAKIKSELKSMDIAFLYAYGGIIPKNIIDLPGLGFWNTHPSLLPKYRGALPITMPLILGDIITGVTLIKLDEKVDHGPIIAQEKLSIGSTDKKSDLEVKLTNLAFALFKKIILANSYRPLSEWSIKTKKQDHTQANYTYQIKKDAGFIPFATLKKALKNEPLYIKEIPELMFNFLNKYGLFDNWKIKIKYSPKIIYDYFRGLYPWPGIWTTVEIKGYKKRLKITEMNLIKGKLTINKVQLEGKKEVDLRTFNSAYSVF